MNPDKPTPYMSRTNKQTPSTQKSGSDKKWHAMKKQHKHKKRILGTLVDLAEWLAWTWR